MHDASRLIWLPLALTWTATCHAGEQGPTAPERPSPPAQDTPVRAVRFDHEHAAWTKVLAQHSQGARLDYRALAKDTTGLDGYLRVLESVTLVDFGTWKRDEQFAFWINAYNAYTVKRVLQSYPFELVTSLGPEKKGPWDEAFIPLGHLWSGAKGKLISLNDVENRILRPTFKDARLHAAVNCAAESCPPLRPSAFTAEKLGVELDQQVTAWLSNDKLNRLDAAKKTLTVSKLFEWYAQDFVDESGSVTAWIAKHGPKERTAWLAGAADLKPAFLDYSWKLNDVPAK